MISFLIACACNFCPVPQNRTNLPWNKTDQKAFESAQKRCKVHFPKSPCLKKFIKVSYNTYHAICGKKAK